MNERERPHSNSGALVTELFCIAVTLGAWLSFAVTVSLSQLQFNFEVILSSFWPKLVEGMLPCGASHPEV